MAYGLPRQGEGAAAEPTEADVARLVESALDRGIETFDTAPAYGVSEARLGAALGGRGRIWTKVSTGDPRASLDASLSRLRRSNVELLSWHNWTSTLASDDRWTTSWKAARSAGAARLGATTYGVADALAAVESGLFDVVQVEYNLLNQRVVRAIGETAARRSVEIAVRSVYLQGALTDEGRELPDLAPLRRGVAAARSCAEAIGLTTLALRAALEQKNIGYVVLGFDRTEQIDAAVRIAAGPVLPPEIASQVDALDLDGDPACDPRSWR